MLDKTEVMCYISGMKHISKKAIIVSTTLAILIPSVSFGAIQFMNGQKSVSADASSQQIVTQAFSSPAIESQDLANIAPEPAEEPKPAPAPSAPSTTSLTAPAKVLSVNEYAQMYLNMEKLQIEHNTPQECLDAIVSLWPHRFTEDVRERNIKALRFYERGGNGSTICGSGILATVVNLPIKGFGRNGEFFDQEIVQQYINM